MVDYGSISQTSACQTDYATPATTNPTDHDSAADCVWHPAAELEIVLTNMTASAFSFNMSASGNFVIDWGDGTPLQTINKTNVTNTTYSHTYAAAGDYVVGISGDATGYISNTTAAISFTGSTNKAKITEVRGNLAKVFPSINGGLTDTTQPNFYRTFYDVDGLTKISDDLFHGFVGPARSYMFYQTFANSTGLTTLPTNMFGNVTVVSGATNLFDGTFTGCTGLTSLPRGLFTNVSGTPANYMFQNTFSGCTGLTGSISSGFFGAFTGAGAAYMFSGTFNNCSGLTGIEDGMWDITGLTSTGSLGFYRMFYGCSNITSQSPAIAAGNPTKLWQKFASGGDNAFTGATKMEDWPCIPTNWGGGGMPSCDVLDDPFVVELTGMTTSSQFSFNIIAAGVFMVDWGDGSVEMFTGSATATITPTHTYRTAGNYEVKIYGRATAYNTGNASAIAFASNRDKITGFRGSLGKIFPRTGDNNGQIPRFYSMCNSCTGLKTLPSELFSGLAGVGTQYMFYSAFYGCTGLTSIPADLFRGIQSSTATTVMFSQTFYRCTGLTSIPATLFADITVPAQNIFQNTFDGCTGLTSLPRGLFANMSGAPASQMFASTFSGCTGLRGAIPSGFFGTYTGAAAVNMFYYTFNGCSNLTEIEDGIWDLSGVTGTGNNSFYAAFQNCSNITSPSPTIAAGNPTKLWQKCRQHM